MWVDAAEAAPLQNRPVESMRILSVGEILWDVIGQAEHLGGAPLNFAAQAQKLGHEVFPLSAVGDDERGHRALEMIRGRGISTEFIRVLKDKPTGTAEVELDLDGKPTFRIVRPVAYDFVELSARDLQALVQLDPQWVYLGTLFHTSSAALNSTLRLLHALPSAQRFYDVNLRDQNWNLTAVEQLSSHSNVVKLNDWEAECLDATFDVEGEQESIESFARRWADRFGVEIVCVTCGERGCSILKAGRLTQIPGFRVEIADTVGAGDAFAAGLVHGLSLGWEVQQIGRFANAVGAVVASKTGAIPEWSMDEVRKKLGA
jgi:fructokinase